MIELFLMFVLSSGGEFNMDISEDSASGFIKIGQDVIQFENFNVKHNNFATLIFAPPDFKILIKNISPTEKTIFAKDGDNTAKYKISLEPQTRVVSNQRDLLAEQNNYSSDEETTSTTFKQQQLLDKQNMLRESEKIYQEQLKRITDHNKKSGDSILNDFEKAKIQTGPDLLSEILEKQPIKEKIKETKNFEIVIFGKNTHNVQQQNDFIFSAKVFEFGKKAHLVDSSNDKLVPNVKLTAQLLDPSGKIYKQFNENLETGVFEEKYKIPTNAPTRGEWTLKITAEKDFGSESSFATWENPFFVSEFDQDGTLPDTTPPVITINQPTDGQTFTTNSVTVSGTVSDPETQINDVAAKLDDGIDTVIAGLGASSWSTTFNDLESGVHVVRIRSTNVETLQSETFVTFIVDLVTPPERPTNLIASVLPPTEVSLTWDAPIDDGGASITGYQIERNLNGAGFTIIEPNSNPTPTSYTDSTLNPGDTAEYRISAINSAGTSNPSDIAIVPTPIPNNGSLAL